MRFLPRSRAGRWGLAAALLALVLVAGALRWRSHAASAKAVPPAAEVVMALAATDVQIARVRSLSTGLPISGSLRAASSAVVKARVAGEVLALSLREGDTVRAGQVLARIDPTESTARVRQLQQQAQSARAQADIAQKQMGNNQALVAQGFISKSALETSQATLQGAEATYQAALSARDVARRSLEDTVLRSPIDGQIAQRFVQSGERVGVEARIFEVVDLKSVEFEAQVSPADSLQVAVGQQASIRLEGSLQPLAARVVRINPSAAAGSRTVAVYLQFVPTTAAPGPGASGAAGASGAPAAPPVLRNGLFAQGTLQVRDVSALAVPLSAVRTDKPAPYVQLVQQGRIAHAQVTLGARGTAAGEPLVAVAGVADGAQVLVGSVGTLAEGTAVSIQGQAAAPAPAMAASSPSATGR